MENDFPVTRKLVFLRKLRIAFISITNTSFGAKALTIILVDEAVIYLTKLISLAAASLALQIYFPGGVNILLRFIRGKGNNKT